MSNYLTRLVERSLGFAPQIEPLIAPLHAPSDQTLSERVETSPTFEPDRPAATIEPSHQKAETSATFESDHPVATIESSHQNAPPDAALDVSGTGLAPSHMEGRPPRLSGRLRAEAELPIQRKDDRIHLDESRPATLAAQTFSVPRIEAVDTVASVPPDALPLPDTTPVISHATAQAAVQPEITGSRHAKAFSLVPAQESPPKETPLLPRTVTTAAERTPPSVVPTEIIDSLKPVAPGSVPPPEPSATKPTLLPAAASRKTTHIDEPGSISPLKPARSPLVPARHPSSNAPPTIHVTIGRIEVRAVLPQITKSKVESSAAPRLSLNDYLKQRNGGRS